MFSYVRIEQLELHFEMVYVNCSLKMFLFFCRSRGETQMSAFECVRRVYRSDGIRGFYRGMSASYAGISETVIHFVIYESIKQRLMQSKTSSNMDPEEDSVKYASDFIALMLAAATSKTCATSIAYPHGTYRLCTYILFKFMADLIVIELCILFALTFHCIT